ncbi:hypothetical protein [uncultured Devosia sp.]|uniref:hypothetical protein n=1 Tax=uncultured Devosia sp. TaxID=211434 RepID=UPI002636169B|nr:hypothetical protein [uncultured Devosia sp.]
MLAALAASLSAVPASATQWMYCTDAEANTEVGLLLGTAGGFGGIGANMRHRTRHWTTDPAFGDGAIFTIGQGFADDAGMKVDFYDEIVNLPVAELRLSYATEAGEHVFAGTLRIIDLGVWAVSCSEG